MSFARRAYRIEDSLRPLPAESGQGKEKPGAGIPSEGSGGGASEFNLKRQGIWADLFGDGHADRADNTSLLAASSHFGKRRPDRW